MPASDSSCKHLKYETLYHHFPACSPSGRLLQKRRARVRVRRPPRRSGLLRPGPHAGQLPVHRLLDEHVSLAGHGDVQTVGHPVLLGPELDFRRGVPALLRPSRRHGDRLAGARRVHGPAPRAAAAQRLARCLRQPDRRSHGRDHRFARHLAQRARLQPAEGSACRDEAPGAGRAGLHRPPVQPRQVAVPAADPGHLHGPDHQLETGGRRGPRDPSLHA